MVSFTQDDIFLVTGASSGLGAGVALHLNKLGATVIGSGRNQERLEEVQAQASQTLAFHCEPHDLGQNLDDLPGWVMDLKKKYGHLKGLVHCAGVTTTAPLSLANYGEALRLFEVDYFAPVLLAKGFADRRVNRGAGSCLTFIASLAAVKPDKGQGLYGGAKAALVNTMLVLAKELAPRGLRVNCISPALIMTPMARQFLDDFDLHQQQEARYPLGMGQVSDVAELAAFLSSDQARWITGQNYILDGGVV